MSKGAKAILILVLALVAALFVMIFMGLSGDPIVVPRSAL